LPMGASEVFRQNLRRIIREKNLKPAQVSVQAGLNRRAVNDLLEERAASPKLSTAEAIATALGESLAEMMGLGPSARLVPQLLELLAQYDPDEQEQLAKALAALRRPKA
jgi:transcriptional regulator with XRE-family HTH domain